MPEGQQPATPGLLKLHTCKIGCLPITDFALMNLVKAAPNIQHLELPGCEQLTEYGLKTVLEKLPNLKFIDLSRVSVATY